MSEPDQDYPPQSEQISYCSVCGLQRNLYGQHAASWVQSTPGTNAQ